MPDSLHQLLTDTRELLRFLRETGVDHLPRSPELAKFLSRRPARAPASSQPPPGPPKTPSKPAPAQTGAPPDAKVPLPALEQELAGCRLCSLHQDRRRLVPGSGSGTGGLLLIEDQPGEAEEASGLPFAGDAGELLDKMLLAIGLTRKEVYLTSLLKCRPPENRPPTKNEIATCRNFLDRQIAAVNPAIICVMGQHAAQLLTGSDLPLFRLRGKFHDFHGIPLLVSFHPGFLLRHPEMKKGSWQDLQMLQKKITSPSR